MREWFAQFDTLVSTIQEKLPLPPLRPRHHWFLAEAIGQAENAVGRQLVPQAEDEYLPGLWPLPNVWLGVSAEDQQRADERIPDLLATPAAVRFVSAEPLLGPLDLRRWLEHSCSICRTFGVEDVTRCGPRIDWVIVGGESGHGARPCDLAWIRSIVEQCRDAGVACFVKQLGADPIDGLAGCSVWQGTRKGSDMADWPDDLRVREFPEVRP
jgi:hypothetical protein